MTGEEGRDCCKSPDRISNSEAFFANRALTGHRYGPFVKQRGSGGHKMAEFGSIFDYEASSAVFCWIGLVFLAGYGLVAIWNARGEPEGVPQPA